MKKKLLFTVILLLIVSLAAYLYYKNKVVYNEESTIGNSSGNLLNGGLFCQKDGKIYFSNPYDDGALYVMDKDCTNFKKLRDEKVAYINVAGKYIFYGREKSEKENISGNIFNFSNAGLYRVDKQGKYMKQLYNNATGIIGLFGNYLYYQRYDQSTGLQLYKTKIDQQVVEQLSKQPIVSTCFTENTLYFTGTEKDHSIKSMNLTDKSVTTIYEGNCSNLIQSGDYIYYLDLDHNYSIYRVKLNGSDPEIIVNERCSSYNISVSGKYLYYQVDDTKNNGFCRINLVTRESQNLLLGNYNNIYTTSNYVFFQQFATSITYILPAGDEGTISTFSPPVLKN